MATSILASLLLGFRKGISEDSLTLWYPQVYKWIERKGGILNTTKKPSAATMKASLGYLSNFVEAKRQVLEPKIVANKDYKNILMLAYYRNILVHYFMHES